MSAADNSFKCEVSPAWVEDALKRIFAELNPKIAEALAAGNFTTNFSIGDEEPYELDSSAIFRGVVDPYIRSYVIRNLAPAMAYTINALLKSVLSTIALQKGERLIVTGFDANGRISESVKLPLWADPATIAPANRQQAGVMAPQTGD